MGRKLSNRGLHFKIFGSLVSLWLEEIFACFSLFFVVLILSLTLIFSGVLEGLWGGVRLFISLVLLSGILWTLWQGIRTFRRPTKRQTIEKLEAKNKLKHSPIATVFDKPLNEDPLGQDVFDLHQKRAQDHLGRLKFLWPRFHRISKHLRWFMVLAPLALLGVCVWQGPAIPSYIQGVLSPFPPKVLSPISVTAWVRPPSYTGQADFFIQSGKPVKVMAQSRLSFSVQFARNSKNNSPKATFGAKNLPLTNLGQTFEGHSILKKSGRFTIHVPRQKSFDVMLNVVGDKVPTIAWKSRPKVVQKSQVSVAWVAQDDYGFQDVWLAIMPQYEGATLEKKALAYPTQQRLKLDGNLRFSALSRALSGRRVTLQLMARDVAGQIGKSKQITLKLPMCPFKNPVAKVLIQQRQILLDKGVPLNFKLAKALHEVSIRPQAFSGDKRIFLSLRYMVHKLEQKQLLKADIPAMTRRLWDIAVQIEDGRVARTHETLMRQFENLQKALSKGAKGSNTQAMFRELEESLGQYVQELSRQEIPELQQAMKQGLRLPKVKTLSLSQLQKQMQKIASLIKQGKSRQAQKMLDQLKRNLQRPPNKQRMSQEMRKRLKSFSQLSKIRKDQETLLNETYRKVQQMLSQDFQLIFPPVIKEEGFPPSPIEQGTPQTIPKVTDKDIQNSQKSVTLKKATTSSELPKPQRQTDLIKRLITVKKKLISVKSQYEPILNKALGAMERAHKALVQKWGQETVDAQKQVLVSLDKLLKSMKKSLSNQLKGSMLNGQTTGARPGNNPFGRSPGMQGGGQKSHLKIQTRKRRAQEIQKKLQEKSQNPDRPAIEKDYFDRLLSP